ncbi:hypothetical protein, partial [Roseomonas mucosa]
MKIELRNIAYSAALSEESHNFHADVWIDGKKEGYAQNHGTGGATTVQPDALRVRLDEYGRTLPQVDIGTPVGEAPHLIVQDAEWIVDALLTDWIERRALKRMLHNRAVYTHLERPGIYQSRVMTPERLAEVLSSEAVKEKWKVKAWLNTMPEEEAVA